jgi:sulfur carrier protein
VIGAGPTVRVNGERRPLRAAVVPDLLGEMGLDAREGIAVAVNGEVVPRAAWARRPLGDGDEVEVVGAAQGG